MTSKLKMSLEQRRKMHERNMTLILNASGPDAAQAYWDKDWHELNVNIDRAEKLASSVPSYRDTLESYIRYAESGVTN